MTRRTLTDKQFNEVWNQEILPDLQRRIGDLDEVFDAANDGAEFFTAVRDLLASLEGSRAGGDQHPNWDEIVGPAEAIVWIARKRCSIR